MPSRCQLVRLLCLFAMSVFAYDDDAAIYLDDAAVITEPAVSRQRSQLAVVIPFTAMEVHHIAVQFKAMQKHSPCRAFPSDATVRIGTGRAQAAFADADVSLVFYFSGDLTAHLVGDFHGPTIQRTLQELWDGLGVLSQCFGGGLRFFSANLSAAPRDGNSDSSCSMFYSLFGLLEPQFDHFFLMEPDVFPVQPFWLDAIVRERSPVMRGPNGVRCEVWQKGSVARCSPDYADNKLRMDFHINGNALYCLNDLAFSDFRNRLRAFYPASQKYLAPGCGTPNRFEGGFDHAFFRFRQDTRNFAYAVTIVSKFQYTNFIVNMCEHEYDERALSTTSPSTFLVHSRWGLLSEEERAVQRAFSKAIAPNRKPRASDLRIFGVRLRHGEYGEEDMLFLLCNGWACTLGDCQVNREVCLPFWERKAELERRSGRGAFNTGGGLVPKDFKVVSKERRSRSTPAHADQPNTAPLELNGGVAVSLEHSLNHKHSRDDGELHREGQQNVHDAADQGAMLPLPLASSEQVDEVEADESAKKQQEAMNAAATIVSWEHKWPGKFYMWSNDFHPTPLICNAKLYNELGVVVHGEIDFGHCSHFGVCKERLKVLEFNKWKGFSLDPCPNNLRRRFFEAYKNDPEMQRIDVFICSHPVANCELFMPFNRSMIIYATTRMEFGRDDDAVYWRKPFFSARNPARWRTWLDNLRALSLSGRNGRPGPRNVIAANNAYDAKYIHYFTGLDVKYLPSWCGDSTVTSVPVRSEILLGASRDNLDRHHCKTWSCHPWDSQLLLDLKRAIKERTELTGHSPKYTFVRTREMYRRFTLPDIAGHPAMVVLPYQASVMFIFEVYRMNVPLFVPSPELLLQWHLKDDFVWERVYGHPKRALERFGIRFRQSQDEEDSGETKPNAEKSSDDVPILKQHPIASSLSPSQFADTAGAGRWFSQTSQQHEKTESKGQGPRYVSALTPQAATQQQREHQQAVEDPCNFWRRRLAGVPLEEMPDPNSDEANAFEYWVQWYDYYQWPYTIWFHSWDHLLELLEDPALDLRAVSARMAKYNDQLRGCLKSEWAAVFDDIFQDQQPGQRVVPANFEAAFRDLYGMEAFNADDQDEMKCERQVSRFVLVEHPLLAAFLTAFFVLFLLWRYWSLLCLLFSSSHRRLCALCLVAVRWARSSRPHRN